MLKIILHISLASLIGLILPDQLRADIPKLKVGAILPLSGPTADYGEAMKNCMQLALQDNPAISESIEFIYEDALYDPKLAVSAFAKLVDQDRVQLIYTWGVSFCKALAPLAESRKIPMIGQCIDPTTAAGREYVIRFMNYADEYMRVQASYLHQHKMNSLGILLADNPYLEEMTEALRRNLLPGQSIEIADRLPATEMNLRSYITKLANSKFDSIGVFLHAGQISQFYKQAAEQRFNKPTFGTNFFESLSEVRAANGTMEGVVFSSNKVNPDFFERYRSVFKKTSQLMFGAPAYEFTLTLGDLFARRTGKESGKDILNAFSGISTRSGVAAGPYMYRNNPKIGKYFEFPVVIKKISGELFLEQP